MVDVRKMIFIFITADVKYKLQRWIVPFIDSCWGILLFVCGIHPLAWSYFWISQVHIEWHPFPNFRYGHSDAQLVPKNPNEIFFKNLMNLRLSLKCSLKYIDQVKIRTNVLQLLRHMIKSYICIHILWTRSHLCP